MEAILVVVFLISALSFLIYKYESGIKRRKKFDTVLSKICSLTPIEKQEFSRYKEQIKKVTPYATYEEYLRDANLPKEEKEKIIAEKMFDFKEMLFKTSKDLGFEIDAENLYKSLEQNLKKKGEQNNQKG